jgi:hypothetical protein
MHASGLRGRRVAKRARTKHGIATRGRPPPGACFDHLSDDEFHLVLRHLWLTCPLTGIRARGLSKQWLTGLDASVPAVVHLDDAQVDATKIPPLHRFLRQETQRCQKVTRNPKKLSVREQELDYLRAAYASVDARLERFKVKPEIIRRALRMGAALRFSTSLFPLHDVRPKHMRSAAAMCSAVAANDVTLVRELLKLGFPCGGGKVSGLVIAAECGFVDIATLLFPIGCDAAPYFHRHGKGADTYSVNGGPMHPLLRKDMMKRACVAAVEARHVHWLRAHVPRCAACIWENVDPAERDQKLGSWLQSVVLRSDAIGFLPILSELKAPLSRRNLEVMIRHKAFGVLEAVLRSCPLEQGHSLSKVLRLGVQYRQPCVMRLGVAELAATQPAMVVRSLVLYSDREPAVVLPLVRCALDVAEVRAQLIVAPVFVRDGSRFRLVDGHGPKALEQLVANLCASPRRVLDMRPALQLIGAALSTNYTQSFVADVRDAFPALVWQLIRTCRVDELGWLVAGWCLPIPNTVSSTLFGVGETVRVVNTLETRPHDEEPQEAEVVFADKQGVQVRFADTRTQYFDENELRHTCLRRTYAPDQLVQCILAGDVRFQQVGHVVSRTRQGVSVRLDDGAVEYFQYSGVRPADQEWVRCLDVATDSAGACDADVALVLKTFSDGVLVRFDDGREDRMCYSRVRPLAGLSCSRDDWAADAILMHLLRTAVTIRPRGSRAPPAPYISWWCACCTTLRIAPCWSSGPFFIDSLRSILEDAVDEELFEVATTLYDQGAPLSPRVAEQARANFPAFADYCGLW